MSPRRFSLSLLLAAALGATAYAADPPPGPDAPLQTRPTTVDDSWMLQGWKANIAGAAGDGKTSLVVNGEAGYTAIATIDGTNVEHPSPATFALADKDYRIDLKVREPRGGEWTQTVDVPKGMKVTVDIKATYEHRGYEGTIKNDTLGCKVATQRRFLKFEVWQNGAMVGNEITLEAGKSAHGVRLKPGKYDLKIYQRVGSDYQALRTAIIDPEQPQWRFDFGCE